MYWALPHSVPRAELDYLSFTPQLCHAEARMASSTPSPPAPVGALQIQKYTSEYALW